MKNHSTSISIGKMGYKKGDSKGSGFFTQIYGESVLLYVIGDKCYFLFYLFYITDNYHENQQFVIPKRRKNASSPSPNYIRSQY